MQNWCEDGRLLYTMRRASVSRPCRSHESIAGFHQLSVAEVSGRRKRPHPSSKQPPSLRGRAL
jgi:hypothetical protein